MIKSFLKKMTLTGIAGVLSLGAGMYVHAQTIDGSAGKISAGEQPLLALVPLQAHLENQIQSDHENALKNRDTRNELLEEKDSANTASVASTSVADQLSLSLSNLENIEWRIDVRAADAAEQGNDISAVLPPLASADQEINVASTSLASTTIDQNGDTSFDASTTASALSSAKDFLGQALDALKNIVGN